MRKYLALTLVLLGLLILKAQAQNLHDDSIKRIAVADARKFKLDKTRLATFRQNRRNLELEYFQSGRLDPGALPSRQARSGFSAYRHNRELASDYFKPVASAVSDTVLLKDSVYVKAYREKALQRTHRRRTVGHYAWMTGAVVAGASMIALWVYLLSVASHVHTLYL